MVTDCLLLSMCNCGREQDVREVLSATLHYLLSIKTINPRNKLVHGMLAIVAVDLVPHTLARLGWQCPPVECEMGHAQEDLKEERKSEIKTGTDWLFIALR